MVKPDKVRTISKDYGNPTQNHNIKTLTYNLGSISISASGSASYVLEYEKTYDIAPDVAPAYSFNLVNSSKYGGVNPTTTQLNKNSCRVVLNSNRSSSVDIDNITVKITLFELD